MANLERTGSELGVVSGDLPRTSCKIIWPKKLDSIAINATIPAITTILKLLEIQVMANIQVDFEVSNISSRTLGSLIGEPTPNTTSRRSQPKSVNDFIDEKKKGK